VVLSQRLLVREVRYRPTSAEALKHPFISGASFFPKYDNIRPGEIAEGAHPILSINKVNQIMDRYGRIIFCILLSINPMKNPYLFPQLHDLCEG
jgi:hypothetical protein